MRRALSTLLLVTIAATACSHAAADGGSPPPRTTTLYVRNVFSQTITAVDVETGATRTVAAPQLSGGDPLYGMAAVGGRLAYYARTATLSLGPGLTGRPRNLGESWYFVPAARPDAAWLALLDPQSPDTVRALRGVELVSGTGRVLVPAGPRPPSPNMVAAVASGPVFQTRRTLEVWNPHTGAVVATIAGSFPVATHDDEIAWCAHGCPALGLTDVATGATRHIHPPAGVRFAETYDGAFSPDGSRIATPVEDRAGRQHPAIVDTATGAVTVVPGDGLSKGYWSLAWGPAGRSLYFSSGRGRIAVYSLASRSVRLLPVELHQPYLDMVALPR